MKTFNPVLKRIINTICLTLSILLSIYFLSDFAVNTTVFIIIIIATINIEILAQLILSKARYSWKRKKTKKKAILLFFIYGWYLLVFALFSGLSFFATGIAHTEQAKEQVQTSQEMLSTRWEENNQLLNVLNQHLLTESKTGYGNRSLAVMTQIEELKSEQIEIEKILTSSIINIPNTQNKISNFYAVASIFKISTNIMKIFVFGTLIVLNYCGLILTNWDISFKKRRKYTQKQLKPEREKTKFYFNSKTRSLVQN